jgi:hypothetical protein
MLKLEQVVMGLKRGGVKWRCDVAVMLQLTQIGVALFQLTQTDV